MMFTGAQGTRKSTFMRMLLPEELRQFYIDRIDFANKKEALRALSRFLLINIDEFDQISKSQTAYLKHLIQRTDVKERKMYETTYQQLQRYAAFVATTNSLSPLKDETGSRRYMVVEVTGVIDTSTEDDKAIDYKQMYAQAIAEIRRGEDCYFDGERERLITEKGAEYYEMPNVVSIFCDHFRKPVAGSETEQMTPTEILAYIHDKWHINLVNQSNAVMLGNYLRREGYERGKGNDRRRYKLSVYCQS
jgi:predicted P-loop ATPase